VAILFRPIDCFDDDEERDSTGVPRDFRRTHLAIVLEKDYG